MLTSPTNRESFEEKLQNEIVMQKKEQDSSMYEVYGLPVNNKETLFNRLAWRGSNHYMRLSIEFQRWYTKEQHSQAWW